MRRLFIILISALLSLTGWGREAFTYIDWATLSLDTIAPEYNGVEVIHGSGEWVVTMKYPEYVALSETDVLKAQYYIDEIGEEINIESETIEVRGERRLRYHFIPIVKRQGKLYRLQSAMFCLEQSKVKQGAMLQAAAEERYAANSAMRSGKWVRISITEDGIYKLTPAFLAKAGFTDVSKVRLYGYGGHEQSTKLNPDEDFDDLPEVPLYEAKDGSLLFWGNGLTYFNGNTRIFNQYANEACYFLSDVSPEGKQEKAKRITVADKVTSAATRTLSNVQQHRLIEKDNYAWYHSGRNLVDADNFSDGQVRTYTFSDVRYTGVAQLTTAFTSAVAGTVLTKTVNGTALPSQSLSTSDKNSKAIWSTKTDNIPEGKGTTLKVELKSKAGADARLDYLALHYGSPIVLSNGFIGFSGGGSGVVEFTGIPAGALMMQIGSRNAPAMLIPVEDGKARVADGSKDFVVFNPIASFPEPTLTAIESNQNLHAMETADMLIVLPEVSPFAGEALRLAEAHNEYLGLTARIVNVRNIYNEFSSGTVDATAIRRFAKMLYDKGEGDEHRLKYVLLFGDGAHDNRMLTSGWSMYSPKTYLPTYQSENSYSAVNSYVCEDYFGMVSNSSTGNVEREGISLAVGRFPVNSWEEAQVMVDKSIAQMSNSNAGAWKNTVVFIGDDGDDNEHMTGANAVADLVQHPAKKQDEGMMVKKIMFDSFTRQTTATGNRYPEVNALINKYNNDGVVMMNYTGHGAAYVLSHENALTLSDVKAWSGTNLPIWYTAACDVSPFDAQIENIGEDAILNRKGGAVAFIGTARTVLSLSNQTLNKAFVQLMFGRDGEGKRYSAGVALMEAKNKLSGTNRLHYCYLGDPALTFGNPVNKVVLDSINGKVPSADVVLNSSSRVRIVGHVADEDGNELTDFNGTLTATLYDAEREVTGLGNAADPFVYKDYTNMLSQRQTTVTGGKWEVSLTTPKDILFLDKSGRFVFYALSDDRKTEANGVNEQFVVGGVGHDFDNLTEGPELNVYLNHENFVNGETVNATPWFYAHIKDTVDVSYLGNSVGHNLLLTIDNDFSKTYVLDQYFSAEENDFTRGCVTFSIPPLENGMHTLTFEAWNNQNLFSRRSLAFNVDQKLKPSPVNVVPTINPAWESTTFIINHQFPGTLCEYFVEVYNASGVRVWNYSGVGFSDGSGNYKVTWNIGGSLQPGIYPYRVRVRTAGSENVEVGQKIIIMNTK